MLFLRSAGILLLLTAWAKLFTVFSGERILKLHDPILGFRFNYEFAALAAVEIALAYVCLFTRRDNLKLGLIAWLTTNFAIYRVGLWSIGIHACPCLGNFPDALHLSKTAANAITISILIYLLAGSYILIFRKCSQK
jgi:hypothetical protein